MSNVIVDIDSDKTIVHIRIDNQGMSMSDSYIADALYHLCMEFNTKANLEPKKDNYVKT